MRDIKEHVPASEEKETMNMIRSIFEQPSAEHARSQMGQVLDCLQRKYPRAADILEEAAEDLLAYTAFPKKHWRRIWSTNPLERLNREIKRLFNVVSIFPHREAVIRLGGALLTEQHKEWVAGRRYFDEQSMAQLCKQDSMTEESEYKVAN